MGVVEEVTEGGIKLETFGKQGQNEFWVKKIDSLKKSDTTTNLKRKPFYYTFSSTFVKVWY